MSEDFIKGVFVGGGVAFVIATLIALAERIVGYILRRNIDKELIEFSRKNEHRD